MGPSVAHEPVLAAPASSRLFNPGPAPTAIPFSCTRDAHQTYASFIPAGALYASALVFVSDGAGSNRRMSAGWHPRAPQSASSVEHRIARAVPVLRIDRLASVIPTSSASSVSVIRRSCSTSSSLTAIATSHRAFEVFAHGCAFREHPRQQERKEYGEPAIDRKAGIH